MRKQKILLIILTIAFGQSFGQSNGATVYKGLQTKEYYSILLSPERINGKIIYKANGKEVSKFIYDKYHSKYKNMETCCPCILKSYDENDVLLREEVSCTDCGVGWFKIYYPNGKVKLSGQYKENPTGNWENIYERGFCNIPEGEWSYLNENGDKLYSEFWKDGEFIKQIPEQKKTEIWRVELTLKGEKIDKQALTADEVKELIVTPKFKNSHRDSINLKINFVVSALGHKDKRQSFSLDSFKNIDVTKMLSDEGISSDKKAVFMLEVYNNRHLIIRYFLNIKV